jgi:hypothetical protein
MVIGVFVLFREKIAAFGSSYRGMRSPVGAAEGCDLLIWPLLQATRVFKARRSALSNFKMSCGSSRCGTFTSMLLFLVMNGPRVWPKAVGPWRSFVKKRYVLQRKGK